MVSGEQTVQVVLQVCCGNSAPILGIHVSFILELIDFEIHKYIKNIRYTFYESKHLNLQKIFLSQYNSLSGFRHNFKLTITQFYNQ